MDDGGCVGVGGGVVWMMVGGLDSRSYYDGGLNVCSITVPNLYDLDRDPNIPQCLTF